MDIDMIVEIPRGSRNKYEMDHRLGRIRLDRMLFTSTQYPVDYGYIPDTLAEDGDPLDVMVLLEEPTFPGCEITVRSVGVFWMHDEGGPDAKILSVPARDVRYAAIRDLRDVHDYVLDEIAHFFDIYKSLEPGKGTDVRGWQDKGVAERTITEAAERARSASAGQSTSASTPR
ncbi:inorganic diphosphatase [Actinomadura sp. 9N215]|uniref:inorganic diphosphatase n=1 Tax=Actinomadura sp. 9N215 TaxID=3375150 RepID=UPI00378821D5